MNGRTVQLHLNMATERRLAQISAELDQSIQDLARIAVEEAALNFFRGRLDDPAERNR